MTLKQRIGLFLKGVCMGVADVIPGVSGGTLALVLGIYREFVDTIRGLHLRWLPLAFTWLKGGRTQSDREALMTSLGTLNLGFLFTLVAGIFTALVLGSLFIPGLMENYPVQMRAFFFGLILASVYVPVQMIRADAKGRGGVLALALVCAVLGAGLGYVVTNPGSEFKGARDAVELEAKQGETLKDLARRGPTAQTSEQIYWMPQNSGLREAIAAANPQQAETFEVMKAQAGRAVLDKKTLKARAKPYQSVVVPAGAKMTVMRPALWFVFVAGAVAICAMILPGISGSYILLIFGVYFFILNAVKGALGLLSKGVIPLEHAMYVSVFITAMVVGILSFSRVLSYLLHRAAAPTLGVLVGLMIGCLRGIWPFQQVADGVTTNVLPQAGMQDVTSATIAALVGFVVVVALTIIGSRLQRGAMDEQVDV